MDTHFPGNISQSADITPQQYFRTTTSIDINEERLKWAIGSFSPFKSPGPDGIIPADLQHNIDLVIPWLINIYKACLTWSYLPMRWTEYNITFIPKGGKISHTKAKDFRPISLSSFLLKTLERIIDIHIRNSIDQRLISPSQHAYMKGKSVETALHSLVSYIEKSLEFDNFTMIAFLDIEGAFNNVKPEVIISALRDLGLDESITRFVTNLLNKRIIRSKFGTTCITRLAVRGTPQGGVLSPLLWNLAMNDMLKKMDNTGHKTVAYADDVAVAVSGFHLGTISQRIEDALKTLSRWSYDSGLSVNPSKTELVLFTRKYKIPTFTLPRLNGTELTISEKAKFLGVVLDNKLSWKPNTLARASKAMSTLYICKKTIGKNWGINPRCMNWLFETVIKPILFYGVSVWWKALDKTSNCVILNKILRRTAILITGALSTTSTKSLFAILNWIPVDLMAKNMAMNTAVRLSATGAWKHSHYGHANIMGNIQCLPELIDYRTPRPSFIRNFGFTIHDDMELLEGLLLDTTSLSIYTDGSKKGERVGGGVYIQEFGIRMSFRIPNGCSILQSEISAIKRAANWISYYRISGRDIRIYTDSKAAIRSLTGVHTTSILVQECRTSLNRMARHSTVTLIWVRGHGDITGNCIADDLARKGALLPDDDIDHLCGIPLSKCKQIVSNFHYELAQTRWENEQTSTVTRLIWPILDRKRTLYLLKLQRLQLSNLVSVVTGHCKFGNHARRLGLPYNDFCRSCNNEEEEETVSHLLCQCPAMSGSRTILLGQPSFDDLSEFSALKLKDIDAFIRSSNWLQ